MLILLAQSANYALIIPDWFLKMSGIIGGIKALQFLQVLEEVEKEWEP